MLHAAVANNWPHIVAKVLERATTCTVAWEMGMTAAIAASHGGMVSALLYGEKHAPPSVCGKLSRRSFCYALSDQSSAANHVFSHLFDTWYSRLHGEWWMENSTRLALWAIQCPWHWMFRRANWAPLWTTRLYVVILKPCAWYRRGGLSLHLLAQRTLGKYRGAAMFAGSRF